jgi:hypothetical protein
MNPSALRVVSRSSGYRKRGKGPSVSIPSIRNRVVQGARKLILEPIFEAEFQPGSYGYWPKKSAHTAGFSHIRIDAKKRALDRLDESRKSRQGEQV